MFNIFLKVVMSFIKITFILLENPYILFGVESLKYCHKPGKVNDLYDKSKMIQNIN